MEKKNDTTVISDEEFLNFIKLAKENNDKEAMLKLLEYFEEEIIRLSKFIPMEKEDAIQTMKVELLNLLLIPTSNK